MLIYLIPRYTYTLQMVQQNRYEIPRLKAWMKQYPIIEWIDLQLLWITLITWVLIFLNQYYVYPFVLILVVLMLFLSIDAYNAFKQTKSIKPLVVTDRVKRQITVLVIMTVLLVILTFNQPLLLPLLCLFGYNSGYVMQGVLWMLEPLEKTFRKRYLNEASSRLDSMKSLIKIGITGSYGKTSSKNIMHEILSKKYYTLMSPASFNTPMGLTRTIRESLKPIHQVFIAEMGADKVGEIKELMDFVHPSIGVLTSIGPQHLNTFKSIENIIKEKFEVIEQLPADGVGILNMDEQYIQSYQVKNSCKILTYAIKHDAMFKAKDIRYSIEGTTFILCHEDNEYEFKTRLLGEHNVYNILAAVAVGHHLGIEFSDLIQAVKQVNYIPHRLELKRQGTMVILDNAFNSNPVGSRMSLDVLKQMQGYRIIMTPGMIDLGQKQDEYNRLFGTYMKDATDLIILVGKKQTQAIYEGIESTGFDMKNVVVVDRVLDGFKYVHGLKRDDIVLLIENDLPDAFNH